MSTQSGALFDVRNSFARADDIKAAVGWAALCGIGMMSVGMMATFFFLLANRNVQLREIKRLELQLARLAEERAASAGAHGTGR